MKKNHVFWKWNIPAKLFFAMLFLFFVSASIKAATIIYVTPNGAGDGSGSDWANAANISAVSSAPANSQIWMQGGFYEVSTTITVSEILEIYGGFSGTETSLEQRNYHLYPTIIDGKDFCQPLNNTSGTPVFDGLIIQNGSNGANGGGMSIVGGTTVRNCIFRNNQTTGSGNGGALVCAGTGCQIINCLFINNTSTGHGGAVQITNPNNYSATFTNCTFANNKVSGQGGAVCLGGPNNDLTLNNCIAYNNTASLGRESYGANTGLSVGRTVTVVNSAIESTSAKISFAANNNIKLTQDGITPGFVSVGSIIGKATVAADIETVESSGYASNFALAEGSPCIDAGKDASVPTGITKDLAGNDRIQGLGVDMGAYESSFAPLHTVFYVKSTSEGDADGTSWDNAATLEDAIVKAAGEQSPQIWMQGGFYEVSGTIAVNGNLEIYGGFSGNETSLDERDYHSNPTIIDGQDTYQPLNNTSGTPVFDGLIIQNGNKYNGNGGGMSIVGGTTVRNCIFRNNQTTGSGANGGALVCAGTGCKVINCLFINNTSVGYGGAVQITNITGYSATFTNCTFANNHANTGLYGGGAVCLGGSNDLTLNNCIAYNNEAGATRDSYGTNGLTGGRTIIVNNSAIESSETSKFSLTGNNNIQLTQDDITPGFVSVGVIIGKATVAADIETVESSDYASNFALAKGSPCIDAGDDASVPTGITKDLAGNDRIQGSKVDMGAYESSIDGTLTGVTNANWNNAGKAVVYESNGRLQVVSGESNPVNEVTVYNLQGALVYKATAIHAGLHTVDRNLPAGAYIVKVVSEKSVVNVKVLKR